MVGGRAVGPRLRGGGLTLLAISAQHLKVGERGTEKRFAFKATNTVDRN